MPGMVCGAGAYREQLKVPSRDSAKWVASLHCVLKAMGRGWGAVAPERVPSGPSA